MILIIMIKNKKEFREENIKYLIINILINKVDYQIIKIVI